MAVIIDEFEATAENAPAPSQTSPKQDQRTPTKLFKLRQLQKLTQARSLRIWAH